MTLARATNESSTVYTRAVFCAHDGVELRCLRKPRSGSHRSSGPSAGLLTAIRLRMAGSPTCPDCNLTVRLAQPVRALRCPFRQKLGWRRTGIDLGTAKSWQSARRLPPQVGREDLHDHSSDEEESVIQAANDHLTTVAASYAKEYEQDAVEFHPTGVSDRKTSVPSFARPCQL